MWAGGAIGNRTRCIRTAADRHIAGIREIRLGCGHYRHWKFQILERETYSWPAGAPGSWSHCLATKVLSVTKESEPFRRRFQTSFHFI